MPTIVDALIVELGLDAAKFDKGRREVDTAFRKTKENAEQIAKDMEQSGKKSAAFFTQLKKEAAELFLVFEAAKGLKNFGEGLKDTILQLGYTAKTLDMSTQELSRWQAVSRLAGGTGQGLTSTFVNLTQAVQQFLTNPGSMTGDMRAYMAALKLSMEDLKDPTKTMFKLVESLKGMDPARQKNLLKNLGADEETINLLVRGEGELRRLYDEAGKFPGLTAEDIEAIKQWTEASAKLSISCNWGM